MGQKVSPVGLRIGINKSWESNWYAEGKDFAKFLKLIEIFEGLKMTIVGGVFLAISLILVLTGTKIPTYLDPAWVTIVICGLPLLYLAISRLIYEHWISSALLIIDV